jgi:hypothetical protein
LPFVGRYALVAARKAAIFVLDGCCAQDDQRVGHISPHGENAGKAGRLGAYSPLAKSHMQMLWKPPKKSSGYFERRVQPGFWAAGHFVEMNWKGAAGDAIAAVLVVPPA